MMNAAQVITLLATVHALREEANHIERIVKNSDCSFVQTGKRLRNRANDIERLVAVDQKIVA